MEDNVQLKEEEVVGDEVVLTDIYPKTNTGSVIDQSSGRPLNETIDFLWQKVNNKLSRVVNSVNNRTGVVVLSSEDVGLGNVDNVSFADIKQWVIDLLVQEFQNKRILLVDYLDEIDEIVSEPYDFSLRDKPFFSRYGYQAGGDKKSYIGYIYYDDPTNSLKVVYKSLKVVGSTDQSLLYNDNNGNLKAHIWRGQDIIKVRDTGVTEDSGLYLDETSLYQNIRYFDGIYSGTYRDPVKGDVYVHGFVDPSIITGSMQRVYIGVSAESSHDPTSGYYYIGNELVTATDYRGQTVTPFKLGEIVYCAFKPLLNNNGQLPGTVSPAMVNREPCFGIIQRHGTTDPTSAVELIFYPTRQNLGWSLRYSHTYKNSMIDPTKPEYNPGTAGKALDVALATSAHFIRNPSGSSSTLRKVTSNLSGMQVIAPRNAFNENTNQRIDSLYSTAMWVNTPVGPTPVFDDSTRSGGLFINTDSSLAIAPGETYCNQMLASSEPLTDGIMNWASPQLGLPVGTASLDALAISNDDELQPYGVMYRPSSIGINLLKAIYPVRGSEVRYVNAQNLSGLAVYPKTTASTVLELKYKQLGMNYGELHDRYPATGLPEDTFIVHSGGVMVNVGKFLEIDPGDLTKKDVDYYNTGKVSVRIGKGLEEEPITHDTQGRQITGNRIQVKIGTGLSFGEDGTLRAPNAIDEVVVLDMVDNYGTHIIYNPIPQCDMEDATISKSTIQLQFGRGLKLITDDMSIEAFITLQDSLTGKQLEHYIDGAPQMTVQLLQARLNGLKETAADNVSILQSGIDQMHRLQSKYPPTMSTLPEYSKTLQQLIDFAEAKHYSHFDVMNMTLTKLEQVCYLDSGATIQDLCSEVMYSIIPYSNRNSVPVGRLYYVINTISSTDGMNMDLITDVIVPIYTYIWGSASGGKSYDGISPTLAYYYAHPDVADAIDKINMIRDHITSRLENGVKPTMYEEKVNTYLWAYSYTNLITKLYYAYNIGGSTATVTDADKDKLVDLITVKMGVLPATVAPYMKTLAQLNLGEQFATIASKLETNDNNLTMLTAAELNIVAMYAIPTSNKMVEYIRKIITAEGG